MTSSILNSQVRPTKDADRSDHLSCMTESERPQGLSVRPHSSLGYKPPAPEAWLTNSKGHGEVETSTRFPLLHTPDGDYLNSEINALH